MSEEKAEGIVPSGSSGGTGTESERPPAVLRSTRRSGYTRFPTGPVSVEPVVVSGPDPDGSDAAAGDWEPDAGPAFVEDTTRLAPWALLAAIVSLCASFFVGWALPVAIVAIVAAIVSLRRPVESRAISVWALVLGVAATLYSLGWLIWAAMVFEGLA